MYFSIVFSFTIIQLSAQSKAFNLMLNSLLEKSVPIIKVSEINQKSNFVYLDARSQKEFNTSHINNAIWVGYDEFSINKLKAINKNANIITYCSVGYRSEKIGEKLQKAGFKNVKNLWGGIFEWVNSGLPVVNNSAKPTLKVHAYSPEWGVWLDRGEKVY
jgi:rhodanese-related sulfurtransferase